VSNEVLVASEFISTVFALILVYFFLKAYRLTRSISLVGLPVGFSFLASSYIFLGVSLLYENDVAVSEVFLWFRLITQSFGFAFVVFTYYFSSKTEKTAKYFLSIISLASVISILLVFGALMVSPPFMEVPRVDVADECFRILNLVFLGYVIYYLVKHLESLRGAISGFIWAPLAFSLLWLAQYSLLIWGIDGSQTAFVFAHVARLVSLTLFIRVYYSSGRAGIEGRET